MDLLLYRCRRSRANQLRSGFRVTYLSVPERFGFYEDEKKVRGKADGRPKKTKIVVYLHCFIFIFFLMRAEFLLGSFVIFALSLFSFRLPDLFRSGFLFYWYLLVCQQ